MNLIVAVDERWGIGRDGNLLTSLPGDMKYFKTNTMDKVVVMGRKTLESMPGSKGLPKRINYVLTSNPKFIAERCTVVHNDEDLFRELKKYSENDVFIIGGESIYRRYLPYCSKCYITKIYKDLSADRFMINLDKDSEFAVTWKSEMQNENGIDYQFHLYERKK